MHHRWPCIAHLHAAIISFQAAIRLEEHWPWLKPTTGLLVWDPEGRGHITSGRLLFGSVTWWMFWRDGYRALDALDDNRDGQLTGAELVGLGVWFDRNSNGRSERGEVRPLSAVGVRALSVSPSGRIGDTPYAANGLLLSDGRALPTFDWTPTSLDR